jgi:hypothetical protein
MAIIAGFQSSKVVQDIATIYWDSRRMIPTSALRVSMETPH